MNWILDEFRTYATILEIGATTGGLSLPNVIIWLFSEGSDHLYTSWFLMILILNKSKASYIAE
jgi:hypothetical protein